MDSDKISVGGVAAPEPESLSEPLEDTSKADGADRVEVDGTADTKCVVGGVPNRTEILRRGPFNYLALCLLAIGTGIISLLIGAANYGVPGFLSYFGAPAVLMLNLVPCVLITLILFMLTRRSYIAFLVTALLVFVPCVINYFKIQLRGSPFVISDILLAGEAHGIISNYSLTYNWKIWFATGYMAAGAVISVVFIKYKPSGVVRRILVSGTILVLSLVLYIFVYTNTSLYSSVSAGFRESTFSVADRFILRGFVYPFIYSASDVITPEPEGYDELEIERGLNAPDRATIRPENKVNVISIMLESYADLSRFGVIDFTIDVYAPLREIQAEAYSGMLVDNVFAGGTIDTERLFLTGFTTLYDFSPQTNSYVRHLRTQGYYTEGFHAGDGWFYNRIAINRSLGFDNYYFLENFEDSNRTDEYFFSKVMELYDNRDKTVPYFNYSLSYQNHGAYYDDWTGDTHYINGEALSDASFNILNNYLTGIYDTTLRMQEFLETYRYDPEPLVVVLFGDHMPWLGNGESVYKELGINVDAATETGYYNLYETPYIIWANESAKRVLDNDFKGDGGSFSPAFLMNTLFKLCSWPEDDYMVALSKLRETIDVVNTGAGVFRENGELTLTLSKRGSEIFNKFRNLEYYRQNNFMY